MELRKIDIHMPKNKIISFYHTQKWTHSIFNLNVRPESIKVLENNIGEKFLDMNLGNDFWLGQQKYRQQK